MENKESTPKQEGCLSVISFFVSIMTFMWVLAMPMMYKSAEFYFFVLRHLDKMKVETFYITDYSWKTIDGKSSSYDVYTYEGRIDGIDKPLKTSASTINVSVYTLKKIAKSDMTKVWYLYHNGRRVIKLKKEFPFRKDYEKYLWRSLSLTFILPMIFLLRFIYLFTQKGRLW